MKHMFDKQYPNGMTINQLAELMVSKFDILEKRIDKLEERMHKLEFRMDVLEHRFDVFEQRFDDLEKRFDNHAKWVRASIHHLADVIEDEMKIKVVL